MQHASNTTNMTESQDEDIAFRRQIENAPLPDGSPPSAVFDNPAKPPKLLGWEPPPAPQACALSATEPQQQ